MQVGPPPRGGAPALIVTGVPWRTGWRYRERGFRHVYWDAGTMLAQLLAVADSAGLAARLHSRFPDAAVAALVGADGVHEWPVAVVALGDGDAGARAQPVRPPSGDVDAAPVEFPLVTAAQRAGELRRARAAWDRGAPVDVPAARGATRSRPSSSRAGRSAAWTRPAACPEPCCALHAGGAARRRRPALRRGARRRGPRAGRVPLAGPRRARCAPACMRDGAVPRLPANRGSAATRRSS